MTDLSEEFKQMVQNLIDDPNDPRTEFDQFLNGYTEYGMVDSEKVDRISQIKARCDAGECTTNDLAHKIGCPVALGANEV